MVEIVRLTEAKESYVEDINRLLPQLRTHSDEHTTSVSDIEMIVADKNILLFVAKDDERIVGMASLYVMHKLGKHKGSIEDVVVDDAYRGQQLGKRLMDSILEEAKHMNLKQLDLTSNPDRIAAHKLYEKLGFKKRVTDVFKLSL